MRELPQGEQGKCWNGQQGTNWDFAGGLGRQIGNDAFNAARLIASAMNPGMALPGAYDGMGDQPFGANYTNKGIFGADLALAAELGFSAVRLGYAAKVSQISGAAAGSGYAAWAMRDSYKEIGRGGPLTNWALRNWKRPSYEVLRRTKSDADIFASAGRSNPGWDAAGYASAAAAASHGACK